MSAVRTKILEVGPGCTQCALTTGPRGHSQPVAAGGLQVNTPAPRELRAVMKLGGRGVEGGGIGVQPVLRALIDGGYLV